MRYMALWYPAKNKMPATEKARTYLQINKEAKYAFHDAGNPQGV